MKTIIVIVLVMACLVVHSQNTKLTNDVESTAVTTNAVVVIVNTNMIIQLGSWGHICMVYGHNWRDGRPGEGSGGYFADYHPNTNFRTCKVCGICQTQDVSWK